MAQDAPRHPDAEPAPIEPTGSPPESDPKPVATRPRRKGPVQTLGEKILENWKLVVGAIVVIAAVLACIQGWTETYLETRSEALATFAQIGDAAKGELVVEGSVEPPGAGQSLSRLRLFFKNHGSTGGQVVLRRLYHPGFTPVPDRRECEVSSESGVFRSRPWSRVAFTLAPGGQESLWTDLRADGSTGSFDLVAVVLWRTPVPTPAGAKPKETWISIPLKGIRIHSFTKLLLAHAGKAFVALLGVLVLPAAGGILAFAFQERQQKLDHHRQAWATMMPKSHEQNMKFYIPLQSTIATLQTEVEDEPVSAFFYLLDFLRKRRFISSELGGFYFRNRPGETLFVDLTELFVDQLLEQLKPREELSRILDLMDPKDESLSSLKEKLNKVTNGSAELGAADGGEQHAEPLQATEGVRSVPDVYSSLEEQFLDWIRGDLPWSFHTLFVAGHLLGYEVNRIYLAWYGQEEEFPCEAINEEARAWWDSLPPDEKAPKKSQKLLARLKAHAGGGREENAPEEFMDWWPPPENTARGSA